MNIAWNAALNFNFGQQAEKIPDQIPFSGSNDFQWVLEMMTGLTITENIQPECLPILSAEPLEMDRQVNPAEQDESEKPDLGILINLPICFQAISSPEKQEQLNPEQISRGIYTDKPMDRASSFIKTEISDISAAKDESFAIQKSADWPKSLTPELPDYQQPNQQPNQQQDQKLTAAAQFVDQFVLAPQKTTHQTGENKNESKLERLDGSTELAAIASQIPSTSADPLSGAVPVKQTEQSQRIETRIFDQIIDSASFLNLEDEKVVVIKLKPDYFGTMKIQLTKNREGIAAQLQTDNPQTQRLLITQIHQLQEAMQEKGLNCNKVDVLYLADHSGALSSGFPRQPSHSSRQRNHPGSLKAVRETAISEILDEENVRTCTAIGKIRAGQLDCLA